MKQLIQLEQLINQLEFNYLYLQDLVDDIDEELMTNTPSKGLENHPAFTIGHVITSYALMIKKLGGQYSVKEKWDVLFKRNGPGDPRYPLKDKKLYPEKEELLGELKTQHEILLMYLEEATMSTFDGNVNWRFTTYFPKTIDFLYFMSITHYAMHISQLAAWRRAMGMPSSLSRM